MISQKEIARLANTSLKTVSRVINNDPLVKTETRSKIEAIIRELGYEPSQAARMMRSQKSNIIGFLADRVATTSTSVDLIRGAQSVAWEQNKQLMLFNIEEGELSAKHAVNQLNAFRAEALIYASVYHRQVDLAPEKLPYVLLNCFDAKACYPAVVPDDFQLGYDLALALFKRGFKRPLFLNLENDLIASRLRAQGFTECASLQGYDVSAAVHEAVDIDPQTGERRYLADKILPAAFAGLDNPDVIVCGQDPMALPVYLVLSQLGIGVGSDVAVVSFDDQKPISELLLPKLSTMALPYYEMGRLAMDMAIKGISDKGPVRLPGVLINRDSLAVSSN